MLSPIVQRELRVALRKRPLHKARLSIASVGIGISLFCLMFSFIEGSQGWGRRLHQYLCYTAFYAGVIVPARRCIRILSDERRGNAHELLALTGLTPAEFFTGKIFGGLVLASSELLALVPLLALPFLIGGVSLEVFLATLGWLPTLLCLSVSMAILASALCSDDSAALFTLLGIAALLCLAAPLPYGIGKALTGSPPFSPAWLLSSPGYPALMLATTFAYGSISEFLRSVPIAWLWCGLCFGIAAWILRRQWRSSPDRKSSWWQAWRERWFRGTHQWRLQLRRRLLDRNPFQWLAQRERRPLVVAWLSIAVVVVLWLLGWLAWPRAWPSVFNFFLTATILLALQRTLSAYGTAHRMAEDRRESHLEIVLTAPVKPAEILDGLLQAARQQFRPLRFATLGLFLLMALGGLLLKHWTLLALITYFIVWTGLGYLCLRTQNGRLTLVTWLALNTARPAFALMRSQARVSGWYWIWMFTISIALSREPEHPRYEPSFRADRG